jgi:AbrB family looped-hinge helix DNA binding protein
MQLQIGSEQVITSKVTSKLQVTIPKAIADRFGIRPGGTIVWEAAGGRLRVKVPGREPRLDADERLRLLRESFARQKARVAAGEVPTISATEGRGWTRDDLYEDRGGRSR